MYILQYLLLQLSSMHWLLHVSQEKLTNLIIWEIEINTIKLTLN